jgi:hypothetical protein
MCRAGNPPYLSRVRVATPAQVRIENTEFICLDPGTGRNNTREWPIVWVKKPRIIQTIV